MSVLREEVFGTPDGIPVAGDFNGDGVWEVGIFREGRWYLDLNGNGQWDENDLWAKLGTEADKPVTGDWDDDGKTDIGIFGPAWARDPWAIENEPGLPDSDNYPTHPNDKAKNVPPTVAEATSGGRVLKRTAAGKPRADLIDHVFHYGTPGDVPVAGDWNGDGIRAIGVYRDGQWTLDLDGDGRFTDADGRYTFGELERPAGDRRLQRRRRRRDRRVPRRPVDHRHQRQPPDRRARHGVRAGPGRRHAGGRRLGRRRQR